VIPALPCYYYSDVSGTDLQLSPQLQTSDAHAASYPLDAGVAGARGLGLTLICRTEHLKNRIKNVEITS
jgi:hypothetical protein